MSVPSGVGPPTITPLAPRASVPVGETNGIAFDARTLATAVVTTVSPTENAADGGAGADAIVNVSAALAVLEAESVTLTVRV